MKYRILEKNCYFYPQYKFIFWFSFKDTYGFKRKFFWHSDARWFLDKIIKEKNNKPKIHPYP